MYNSWRESDESSILWITAKPGCGKTTLAAHISYSTLTGLPYGGNALPTESTNPVVLYFFFQRISHESGQTALAALKTFTNQLVLQQPDVLQILLRRYKKLSAKGGFAWSWENVSSVLGDMLKRVSLHKLVHVILDAVDECETNSQILIVDWIKGLIEAPYSSSFASSRATFKILATSRPDGSLLDMLEDIPTLAIQENDTAKDIRVLIHSQVEHFARKRHIRENVAQSIAHFLEENARGMFLWVVLVMKELERRDERLTDEVIAAKLSKLPMTLAETYKVILHAPPLARREDMWRVIRWILYACRDIDLDELEAGLCLEGDIKSWHGFAGDLEYLCGSLIRYDGTRISLVHQTARTFLESFVRDANPLDIAELSMDSRSANERLAMTCIEYLSKEEVFVALDRDLLLAETPALYTATMNNFLDRHPFYRYATEGWIHHIRGVGSSSPRLDAMIHKMFSSEACRENILTLTFFIFKQESSAIPSYNEPIHLAAYFDLPRLVKQYIAEDAASVHAASDTDDTPLVWASEMGSTECVRLLLDAGADPNQTEYDGWSALHWAARNNHVDVAELLLKHGAKVDQQDGKGHTPLDWALDREHRAVIEVLRRWDAGTKDEKTQASDERRSPEGQRKKNVWKLWDYRP
jgi:hypothetical protein